MSVSFKALCVSALCALVTVVGCNKSGGASGSQPSGSAAPAADKVVKLAFVTNNASEFWKIAAAGVHKYEKESKIQVDITGLLPGSQATLIIDLVGQPPGDRATAWLERPDSDYRVVYWFRRSDCWRLERMEDRSL